MRRLRAKEGGFTLIELMIVVAIVGILAAVAIPSVRRYAMDSKISDGISNVQGILTAEQAFFTRFERYTNDLPWCPAAAPPGRSAVPWVTTCGGEWSTLGWRPDGPTYFVYRVLNAPANFQDFNLDEAPVQPWCGVEAVADTDGDGQRVTLRANSVDYSYKRSPNLKDDGNLTW
ncbi:MAG: prepilin-type N-terminal cleavage/methylation domain-containing protein [Deltaproteobacteria bacterium]|nr:MAG: prepilin-type N-terminal cleavage/methylation domain-containing protein [Deltaproteobacteria bacterium]